MLVEIYLGDVDVQGERNSIQGLNGVSSRFGTDARYFIIKTDMSICEQKCKTLNMTCLIPLHSSEPVKSHLLASTVFQVFHMRDEV